MNETMKSFSGCLKEISLRHMMKIYLVALLTIMITYIAGFVLNLLLSDYHVAVLGPFLIAIAVLSLILNIFIPFDIMRNATGSRFEYIGFLKFLSISVLIYIILIPSVLLFYLTVAYHTMPLDGRPADSIEYVEFLGQNIDALLIISVFILLLFFYAPFIQYIESRGSIYSLKKSIMIFIKKPAESAAGVTTSFLLFIIPSIITMLPFTSKMSDVIAIIDYNIFIPLTIIPATFGMTIGLILMYSFIVKYYENKLINIS